jgi:hypothetical protein
MSNAALLSKAGPIQSWDTMTRVVAVVPPLSCKPPIAASRSSWRTGPTAARAVIHEVLEAEMTDTLEPKRASAPSPAAGLPLR